MNPLNGWNGILTLLTVALFFATLILVFVWLINDVKRRKRFTPIKQLIEEHKYDADFILEGLKLDLATELKELMTSKNLTKREFAKIVGVKTYYLTKIFQGNVTLKKAARLLGALEIDAKINIVEEAKQ